VYCISFHSCSMWDVQPCRRQPLPFPQPHWCLSPWS
jgi:hypothetical protein